MALPVHAMSCFKLPVTTCRKLTSAMSAFWWNSMENKSKIHWISWERLCIPKKDGGLGFKDIQLFNQALLAKQAWRLLHFPDCLLSRFLKSRYFPDTHILQAQIGSRPSYAWRSILYGRELLVQGLSPRIGDGKSVWIWSSPWLPDSPNRAPLMKNIFVDIDAKVDSLINEENRTWDRGKLSELFYQADIDLILTLHPIPSIPDYWVWKFNHSGEYSVKSGYWFANQTKNTEILRDARMLPSLNPLKDIVWQVKTAPKIKCFLWKVLSGAIPVADNLIGQGLRIDSRCQRCGNEGESTNHVLFTCTVARQVWALSSCPFPLDGFSTSSIYSNLHYVLTASKNSRIIPEVARAFPWILWLLWKNRNKLIFDGSDFNSQNTVNKALEDSNNWFLAQEVESTIQASQPDIIPTRQELWQPPQDSWVKCNITTSWIKNSTNSGASWVVRNDRGEVLLHARRSFALVPSQLDASYLSIRWAIESLSTLGFQNVLFAATDRDLVNAVSKPSAWPSLLFYSLQLIGLLGGIQSWDFVHETKIANEPARKIANSALFENRFQSYIATGPPFWLRDLFDVERSNLNLPGD